jgi:hypothetical protein
MYGIDKGTLRILRRAGMEAALQAEVEQGIREMQAALEGDGVPARAAAQLAQSHAPATIAVAFFWKFELARLLTRRRALLGVLDERAAELRIPAGDEAFLLVAARVRRLLSLPGDDA